MDGSKGETAGGTDTLRTLERLQVLARSFSNKSEDVSPSRPAL